MRRPSCSIAAASSARFRRSVASIFRIFSGNSMFSRTVIVG